VFVLAVLNRRSRSVHRKPEEATAAKRQARLPLEQRMQNGLEHEFLEFDDFCSDAAASLPPCGRNCNRKVVFWTAPSAHTSQIWSSTGDSCRVERQFQEDAVRTNPRIPQRTPKIQGSSSFSSFQRCRPPGRYFRSRAARAFTQDVAFGLQLFGT